MSNEIAENLDSQIVAKILGVSKRAVEQWRSSGAGPCYHAPKQRVVRYRLADVLTYRDFRLTIGKGRKVRKYLCRYMGANGAGNSETILFALTERIVAESYARRLNLPTGDHTFNVQDVELSPNIKIDLWVPVTVHSSSIGEYVGKY